jgi:UDP-3-O-[3-hydroxymyristoyl] glucosamine N-acyltransferase
MTLKELADRLGADLQGDGEKVINALASLEEAKDDELAFLANVRYTQKMAETSAGAVIVAADYQGPGENLLRCQDPYFGYREAMVLFYGFREHPIVGMHPTACVDATAEVDASVALGAHVTISRGATVDPGTVIYPGVFVGPGCRVGRDCVLYPNVCLYDGSVLGNRVTVHANSSIGVDGFGYATHTCDDGVVRHDKIPPVGWVELEDDVEIGSCCAIERATMGPTVIGAGTKFADLVAIGHGTKLGKHCLMVSQAGIAGSTVVGNYCVFAGQAGVVGHIRIGDGVRVGAQAGVTGDLDSDVEVLGSPAIPRVEAGRSYTLISRLPEMRANLRKLSKDVERLRARIADLEGGQEQV